LRHRLLPGRLLARGPGLEDVRRARPAPGAPRRGGHAARGSHQGAREAGMGALRGIRGADPDDGGRGPRAPEGPGVTVRVTGADGFVGRGVVRALVAAGHAVGAAAGPGGQPPADLAGARGVRWVALDLRDPGSVAALAAERCDAVLHLAGLA